MDASIKSLVRHYCPNIGPLREWMKNEKLKEYKSNFMDSDMVLAGEKSESRKQEAVEKYIQTHPKHAGKIQSDLNIYCSKIKDADKKEHMKTLEKDVMFCCFAYGFEPDEYFFYSLEDKTVAERRSYISDLERYRMVYQVNDIIDMDIYLDKYHTYRKFRQYYKRDAVAVDKKSGKKEFLNFVQKHPVFVQKNVALSRGESVALTDIRDVDMDPEEYYDFLAEQGKYIVEEKVEQSDVMNGLNPSSVNTVRCNVFQSESGVHIGPCFIKIGQGNTFVDNGGAGGILVGVNRETGMLSTNGRDEFLNKYSTHPDTHTVFIGYQLPEWNQMLALVKEMSEKTPSVRYISWDMAHTGNGWIVMEGNSSGQMIGPQMVFLRGFKQDIKDAFGGVLSI